jgi:hypothetical protein
MKRSKLSLKKSEQVIHGTLNDMERFSAMKHCLVRRVLFVLIGERFVTVNKGVQMVSMKKIVTN